MKYEVQIGFYLDATSEEDAREKMGNWLDSILNNPSARFVNVPNSVSGALIKKVEEIK